MAGELILKGIMPSYGAVTFHAQQAAEKGLKALLIRHQVDFGRTHNLGTLLGLADVFAAGIAGKLTEVEVLTPYAVETRYPTEEPSVLHEEAHRHLTMAKKVVAEIRILLQPYLNAGCPGR